MASNLLDEAVGSSWNMILVEDCVETSGSCLIHHLLKRSLSSSSSSSNVVVFLSFTNPFSHYDRILRKMGCNLVVCRDNRRLLFFDMLMLNRQRQGKTSEDFLLQLYGEIQRAIQDCSSPQGMMQVTVIIDDISLMEVDAKGSHNLVSDFVHYCYSLTSQTGCLIILHHEDVYTSMDKRALPLQLEYLADVVIKVEPLATGLATDIHGQLTVFNKGARGSYINSNSRIHNFNFKVKESCTEYFYSGTKSN